MTANWWRWLTEVTAAWLMPWRAVRKIHGQDRDLEALVFALADGVARRMPYERDRVTRRLADALIAQRRQLNALQRELNAMGAASAPRRLHVVK